MSNLAKAIIGSWSRGSAFVTRANVPRPDLALLDTFKVTCSSLGKLSMTRTHPMHSIARKTRDIVQNEVQQKGGTVTMALFKADLFLEQQSTQLDTAITGLTAHPLPLVGATSLTTNMPLEVSSQLQGGAPPANTPATSVSTITTVGVVTALEQRESSLRVRFARDYIAQLKKLQEDKELTDESMHTALVAGLMDAMLLGTSSERIAAHLHVFGPSVNQEQFRSCMYSILEPEVSACLAAMQSIQDKALTKKNRARAVRIAKTFLLDVVELNTKVRCVMAWSDPNYSGFAAVPESTLASVRDLTLTRRKYFGSELDDIGGQFAAELVKDRNRFYANRTENRETLLKGTIFFIVTCLADWGIWAL